MKIYEIKTTEERTYTGWYVIEAESEEDARKAFNEGNGVWHDEEYEDTTYLEILDINEWGDKLNLENDRI